MGRNKIKEEEKKIKLTVSLSLSPDVVRKLKYNCINLSSLVNKLLKEYIENGNKSVQ